jgi:hypothetical protein
MTKVFNFARDDEGFQLRSGWRRFSTSLGMTKVSTSLGMTKVFYFRSR